MKEIKAYQCDYCHTRYYSESAMASHEEGCLYNPTLKRCQTCKHSIPQKEETENGMPKVVGSRKCKLGIKQLFNKRLYREQLCDNWESE